MTQANNNITLTGRVGNLELKTFNDKQNITVSLAVSRSQKDSNGEYITDWFPCVFWGNNATYVDQYIKKGDLVVVTGSVNIDKFEKKDGSKGTYIKVNGSNIKLLTKGERETGSGESKPKQSNQLKQDVSFDDFQDDIPPF